jgi:hypothetical protein
VAPAVLTHPGAGPAPLEVLTVTKSNRRVDPDLEQHRRSAKTLAEWILRSEDALVAVKLMRGQGDGFAAAVSAALEEKQLAVLRVGWELWASLLASDGTDSGALLEDLLHPQTLETASLALWGTIRPPFYCPRLRLYVLAGPDGFGEPCEIDETGGAR